MKAILYDAYGTTDNLRTVDIPKPVPEENEVLIKIHAASVNSWDWDLLRGKPVFIRMWGWFKPKYRILGSDIAGIIETVGSKVRHFKSGDEVFGDLCQCGWGGFAEYVCAPENILTRKPPNITYEEAASIPQAGVLAWQGIFDYGKVSSGDKVLINGAGGGVGTFAIQMAKSLGAKVTGVDHTDKLDMMRSVGADHVLDYTKVDFTRTGIQYNFILDNVASRSMTDYLRALSPDGTYVMVGGSTGSILQCMLFGSLVSYIHNRLRIKSKRKLRILAHKPNYNIDHLLKMFESDLMKPVIDRIFPLEEVPEALRRLGEGKVRGKIIITTDVK